MTGTHTDTRSCEVLNKDGIEGSIDNQDLTTIQPDELETKQTLKDKEVTPVKQKHPRTVSTLSRFQALFLINIVYVSITPHKKAFV